ncbi:MAG: ATP-binding protein [Phenylobacterium sp.]|uniref:ATP-binding protein n=1 Tax=Phenylobacterium sp. TaxID=1871053 RepID=UPI00391D46E9
MGPTRLQLVIWSIGFALAAMACVAFSLGLTRGPSGVATVWMAGGVLAAAFLILPWRWSAGVAATVVAYNFAHGLWVGNPLGPGLAFPLLNLTEAVATAWLARRVCGPRVRLDSLPQVGRLILLAAAPATSVCAVLAANVLTLMGRNFDDVILAWFAAHGMGMAIVLPSLLLLLRSEGRRSFAASPAEQVALYGAAVLAGGLVLAPLDFPTQALVFPAVCLAALRLGPRGAAASALIVLTLGSAALVVIGGAYGSAGAENRALQGLVLLALVIGLAVGQAAAEQKRLARRLRKRRLHAAVLARRAIEAERAKAAFLSRMSHELRTPLASIVGFAEVLQRRPDLPDAARRQAVLIDRAGAALTAAIGDILEYARLEASQVELDLRPVVPRAAAQETLALVQESARAKGIDLQLALIGPVEAAVMADGLRVRQVLLNLLANAVKFTERGHVRLEVRVSHAETARTLRFTVADTGCGLPPDRAARLFKPFGGLEAATDRLHGGTGLGLAVARRLAEHMGGRIGVDSALGVGSAFWFETPAPLAGPAAARPAVLGGRVLIVDDHPVNREVAATLVGTLSCEAACVDSGQAAVEAIRSGRFDLVLMDIHMPGLDGLAAARQIRALEGEAAAIPIVGVSADTTPATEAAGLRAGMNAVIAKPLDVAVLERALAALLPPLPDTRAA